MLLYRSLLAGAALAPMLFLTACDGGGSNGGGSPTPTPTTTPTPTNSAPVFNSATAVSVAENTTTYFYTATSTDADGNTVTYSINGGADAALFQIDATGHLSFRSAPDFEAPRDADRNNIYQVTIAASDGTASATLALAVTVTDSTTGSYHVRQLHVGFNKPTNLVQMPGRDDAVFVTQKNGYVNGMGISQRILGTGLADVSLFLDLRSEVSTDADGGLIGITADPQFEGNGYIYVALTTPAHNLEVRRYRTYAGTRAIGDPSSADVILSVPTPDNNFTGGWIGFGPDGYLYVTTGSGPNPGSNPNDLFGKVLRIDVRSDAYPADPLRDYAIPADNPFATAGGRPEIWALGFRQPRRAAFDSLNGNLYVSDWGAPVGGFFEPEINMIRPQDKGLDFTPWRERLGSSAPLPAGQFYPLFRLGYGLSSPSPADQLTLATGPVYRGPIESLQGKLFYGSYVQRLLATRNAALFAQNTVSPEDVYPQTIFPTTTLPVNNTDAAPIDLVYAFGEDGKHNLYILQPNGKVLIVEPD
ncbi:PQQ-dependent sugar dehydrogenase [Sphingomonas sp. Sphisp140]|uniref:PQQ-dependent sugar dehydrogenase n=1 Tax=unclassified Sphingomonas TaxID=196159 RepID=UPI0039AFFD90